jgi:hypothetical protein
VNFRLLAILTLAAAGCAPRAAAPTDRWADRFPHADTLRVEPLVPGVRHAYLWLGQGPWAIHVVEIDEARCRPIIAAPKAGPPLPALAPTTALAGDAVVAINADFFMDPGGTPVGAHVSAGRVIVGPGARPVYALDAAGRHHAGSARLVGFAATGADSILLVQVNRPPHSGRHHPPGDGMAIFDGWFGDRSPGDAGLPAARVRRLTAAPYEAGRGVGEGPHEAVHGVLETVHEPGATVGLDDRHVALQPRGDSALAWLARRSVGDTIVWRADVIVGPVGGLAWQAVGGFPMLVQTGRGVVAEQPGVIPTFGPVRHPRTAVGWDQAGRRLLWVVVDGRHPGYSDGMTLAELERLFLDLGATHAINLDGGGSTTLVLRGRIANRPSDPSGERAVANALTLEGCR